jgi:uncharacterized membrane protein YGL010W
MAGPGEDRLSRLFSDYERYHRHPANKLCHYLGIPVIVFTLVGLLELVPLVRTAEFTISLAVPVAVLAVVYDLRLSPRLALLFGAFVLGSFVLAPALPTAALWAGFAFGWLLQLVGHYVYEKKSPAFFDNLHQLLIGPLWILETRGAMPSTPKEAPGSVRPSE